MHRIAVVAVLSACGFSGSTPAVTDGPTSADAADPDAALTDAPLEPDATPDAAPLDSDNDTILDDADNCPSVANVDQRNYDGDPRGDACDPCPHLANLDDDPDNDNIGVGCDPRPAMPDTRLLWTSFHDATTVADWSFPSGTWAVSTPGRLRQTNAATDYALAVPPFGTMLGRVYVATRYTVEAHGTPGGDVSTTGLGVSSANLPGQYDACIIARTGGGNSSVVAAADWQGSASLDTESWPGTYGANATVNLVHDTFANNRCRASQGNTTVTAESTRSPSLDGLLFLYTQRAAGYFEYAFVVDIGD